MYVIQCMGLADGRPVHIGEFLRFWDPDGNDGRGSFVWTTDASMAMQFRTTREALEEYKLTSLSVPLRPDGEPNRPMTMFSVGIVPLLSVLEVRDGHE